MNITHFRLLPPSRLSVLRFAAAFCAIAAAGRADTTISYDPTAAGSTNHGFQHWSFDVKNTGQSKSDIDTSVSNAGGSSAFDSIRTAWYPQDALNSDGTLSSAAKTSMDAEATLASHVTDDGKSGPLPYFLSTEAGNIDPSYVDTTTGLVIVNTWIKAMEESRDYYINNHGATIKFNGVVNEPDHTIGKINANVVVKIRNGLSGDWGSTEQVLPCMMDPTNGVSWLPTILPNCSMYAVTTHADGYANSVATELANYKDYYNIAVGPPYNEPRVWNSEAHQLAEVLTGADLGFSRACFWGGINAARGEFIQQATDGNARLFYKEFGNWGATACYKDTAGGNSQYIFIGNKDVDNSYTLVYVTSIAVSFNGGAKSTSHTVAVGALDEQSIHVTW